MCTTEQLAARAAKIWKSVPTNSMQLNSNVELADADGDGLIDQDEFQSLLEAAGAMGLTIDQAKKLFAQADKDGDGELTMEELKTLGAPKREKALNR